ncbi:DUF2163 domain-containing protein [Flavobacterium sp.]|jgi:uncharacterized phage protein (TIGR02218 family)|uniref:DUF2163 domain-containing protein n=1 Tax=Flavobacterium sp. TaxID=239 RepID=UPI0037BE4342
MKSVSFNFRQHIKGQLTTLATLWRLERRDGLVMAFTDFDEDIFFNNIQYKASGGYTPSAVETNSGLAVDNLNIQSIIDHESIKEEDIRAGVYDYAAVEILLVNYKDLSMGSLIQRNGILGEVTSGRVAFEAELRGMTQPFSQKIGRVYTAACQANLGDARCKVNLTPFTFNGTVSSVTDNRRFNTSLTNDDNYFNGGLLTWMSGPNLGLKMEVKTSTLQNGFIELQQQMIYPVSIGDTFSVYKGCDKTDATCKAGFNNIVNFRGFPYVPGRDKLYGK